MTRLRPLFSPVTATIIALVALLCSLDVPASAARLITGADVKDNSLTGQDVREGSLAKVPAAGRADRLGDDVRIQRIWVSQPIEVQQQEIARVGSLRLGLSCSAGEEYLYADTTDDDAEAIWIAHTASDGDSSDLSNYDDDVDPGNPMPFGGPVGQDGDISGTLHYTASNGDVVLAELSIEDDLATNRCVVTGYLIG